MPKLPNDYAADALRALEGYSPNTFQVLEKKCFSDKGIRKETLRNMRQWMIDEGFATDAYVGHLSKPKGGAIHKQTDNFVKAVAARLRNT